MQSNDHKSKNVETLTQTKTVVSATPRTRGSPSAVLTAKTCLGAEDDVLLTKIPRDDLDSITRLPGRHGVEGHVAHDYKNRNNDTWRLVEQFYTALASASYKTSGYSNQ